MAVRAFLFDRYVSGLESAKLSLDKVSPGKGGQAVQSQVGMDRQKPHNRAGMWGVTPETVASREAGSEFTGTYLQRVSGVTPRSAADRLIPLFKEPLRHYR